jgi:pimeloyl-ACP methyl ester carboxylesterase
VLDHRFEAGTASLYIRCVGKGEPVVAFDAGMGNDGSVWDKVQPGVGDFTEACVYDRAGLGRSGPATRPHTNRLMAQELHALLHNAGLAGPYVLVAHSMGGVNVRLFAAEHPDEVAGMVLVDASEDMSRTFALLPDQVQADMRASMVKIGEGLDWETSVAGFVDMRASSVSIGDTPLVVLTHGRTLPPRPGIPVETEAQIARIRSQDQAELPKLSTNGVQVIDSKSGHYLQLDNPELVVAGVRTAVQAARTHSRLDIERLAMLAGAGAVH